VVAAAEGRRMSGNVAASRARSPSQFVQMNIHTQQAFLSAFTMPIALSAMWPCPYCHLPANVFLFTPTLDA